MKTRKLKNTTISLILIIVALTSKPAAAQKAPEYSNEFLMDNKTVYFFMADRLEFYNVDGSPLVWDTQGYIGKDLNKFWYRAEGNALTTRKEGDMEFRGLYSRAISAYFDVQAGIRYDIAYNRVASKSRGFAVIGLQGLAPYLFELNTNLFLSQDGDVSANFEAEYNLPITQRLWGQPRVATSVAVQEVPEWGVGNGFNNVQLGFRLRYEIEREFAPYIGISWNRKLGETADFVRDEGGAASTFGLVGGVRMWF